MAREASRPTRGTTEECAYAIKFSLIFRVPRGCYALGDGGQLMAVQAPLTPRPRGTIYEALPIILERVWGGPRQGAYPVGSSKRVAKPHTVRRVNTHSRELRHAGIGRARGRDVLARWSGVGQWLHRREYNFRTCRGDFTRSSRAGGLDGSGECGREDGPGREDGIQRRLEEDDGVRNHLVVTQWLTTIQPQSRRAHGGRTTEATIRSEENMLFVSNAGNRVNSKSLRTLRLCG